MRRNLDAADVLGEVHPRLHLAQRIGDPLGELVQPPRQLSGDLGQREFVRRLGLGPDQIGDRLGLSEVDPSVHERAQREFSRPRESRPGAEQGREHAPRRDSAAVTGDLDHVLARVRSRSPEQGDHDLVEPPGLLSGRPIGARNARRLRPDGPAVVQRVARGSGEAGPTSKHAIGDLDRPGPARSHDREPRGTGSGRDGHNGLVQHRRPAPPSSSRLLENPVTALLGRSSLRRIS